MDKKLINALKKAGLTKDAQALEKDYSNSYFGLKMAQLEDTPFIPVRQKLEKFDPQLDKEKAWHRGKLPMSGQQRGKFLQDPRVQGIAPSLGGESALGFGMPYRDPASIARTSDPDEMIERIRERGFPPHGLTTEHGRILDVDPKHPIDEIGPRGGKKYGEEFDFGEGADIGLFSDGEFKYEHQEDLDPGLVEMIQKVWGEGVGQFQVNVQSAMERFNKRLEKWMTDGKNQMLSTNFMTQLNQVVCGSKNDVWDATDGESLSAVIIKRMQNVQDIRDNTIRSETEGYSDLQADLFTKYIDDLNSGKDYPSEMWLNKLMLVYGQDPRKEKDYIMDVISDNPLDVKYPDSFLENIVLPYEETKRKSSGGGYEREQKELNWSDILSRSFKPITTGAEETAKRRKMIEDVDIWKGLVGSGGKPLISSQKDVIVFQYNQELMHLLELLKDLQRMLNIRKNFESAKLIDTNPSGVEEMDLAVLKFARTLEQHYKQGELATAEGKLMGNYSVGSETKLEIYLKSLYILQAYEAWSSRLTKHPIEDVIQKEEPDVLKDIEQIEADESMIPKSAFSYNEMVKIANQLDEYGLFELADKMMMIYD